MRKDKESEESLKPFPLSSAVFKSNTHCTCICVYQYIHIYILNKHCHNDTIMIYVNFCSLVPGEKHQRTIHPHLPLTKDWLVAECSYVRTHCANSSAHADTETHLCKVGPGRQLAAGTAFRT